MQDGIALCKPGRIMLHELCLYTDDEAVVLVRIAAGDEPRVQHLPKRQVAACQVLQRAAQAELVEDAPNRFMPLGRRSGMPLRS